MQPSRAGRALRPSHRLLAPSSRDPPVAQCLVVFSATWRRPTAARTSRPSSSRALVKTLGEHRPRLAGAAVSHPKLDSQPAASFPALSAGFDITLFKEGSGSGVDGIWVNRELCRLAEDGPKPVVAAIRCVGHRSRVTRALLGPNSHGHAHPRTSTPAGAYAWAAVARWPFRAAPVWALPALASASPSCSWASSPASGAPSACLAWWACSAPCR